MMKLDTILRSYKRRRLCWGLGVAFAVVSALTAGGFGCRPDSTEREKRAQKSRAPSQRATSRARSRSAPSPRPPRPRSRSARLARRIEQANEKLKEAMVAVDRSNLKQKPLHGPEPKTLAEPVTEIAKQFPSAFDELGEYFAKAARFVDLYARVRRVSREKKKPVASGDLKKTVSAFNEIVAAHNAARLGLQLSETLAPTVDPRPLDPRSYSHKVDRRAAEIHQWLGKWYRHHGGRPGVPVEVPANRLVGFRVGVLRLERRCQSVVDGIKKMKCQGDEERCQVFRKRARSFRQAVAAFLSKANELAERALDRLGGRADDMTKQEKDLAQKLRQAYRRVTGSRGSILSG